MLLPSFAYWCVAKEVSNYVLDTSFTAHLFIWGGVSVKSVQIEFKNIQSHQHTAFSLEPGLNFILADDNNVGKSTIFKALLFLVKMPKITNDDAIEILRVGSQQGYMSFKFDNHHIVLWLFREDGDRVRVFFEDRTDGGSTRCVNCPDCLLEALDIVKGEDGEAINFNDADSVQLIVQDTPKNDKILSRVLTDLRVDAVKKNSQALRQQIIQDYRLIYDRHAQTRNILSSLVYNEFVDMFNAEKELLQVAVKVLDLMDVECVFEKESQVSIEDIEQACRAQEIYNSLSSVGLDEVRGTFEIPEQEELQLDSALRVMEILSKIDVLALKSVPVISAQKIDNLGRLLVVLGKLTVAADASRTVASSTSSLEALEVERQRITELLERNCQKVICPVKGEVFYSGKECISTSD